MSQYKELADRLEETMHDDAGFHLAVDEAIAILRSLDAQEPVAKVECLGTYYGKPFLGCVLGEGKAKEGDSLYAAPVAAQPGMVYFPNAIALVGTPWESLPPEKRAALTGANPVPVAAQPQQAKPLSDEEIAFCIFESKMKNPAITRDGTTSIRIARAAITAFCQKNGIKEQG